MAVPLTPAQLAALLGKAAAEQMGKVARAVTAAGFDTQNRARVRAPVDTGFLRQSITVDSPVLTATEVTIEVGPVANYGAFVEYGTARSNPQPYMEPAIDEVTPILERALAQLDVL